MADDDAPLIIGGIIALAAVFALHHGLGGPSTSSSSGGSSMARHTASTSKVVTLPMLPVCTRVVTVKSRTGTTYTQFPVSSDGNSHCYLTRGSTGMPVAALQRGMSLCMGHSLVADGVYGAHTASAVARVGRTGTVYGPITADHMRWPWFSSTTTKFTTHCSTV